MNPAPSATLARRAAEARAAGEATTRRFDDTLRAARRAAGRDAGPTAAERDVPSTPLARRTLADAKAQDLAGRRDRSRADDGLEPPRTAPGAAMPPPPPRLDPAAAPSDLRALVRTLPVSVEAARVREGAPLALELGAALSVEVRQVRGGLELVLRPDAAVSRAAAAELPAVVRALRARGLAVARAEVRARPQGGPRAPGPRVDGPPSVG
jgi:hypothetical protein